MSRPFAKKFYRSKQWQGVRDYIVKRDKYMCRQCGSPKDLEVHHIEWLNEGNILNPEITLNENNLITLCRDCHFKTHEAKRIQGMKQEDIGEEYCFDDEGNVIQANSALQ